MAFFGSSKDLFELISRPDAFAQGSSSQNESLLQFEGKTLVIIDEWPEESGTAREVPILNVRKDTAIVLGILASALIGVSFLAGRATVRNAELHSAQNSGRATLHKPLPKNVFDPATPARTPTPAPTPSPRVDPSSPAPVDPLASNPVPPSTVQRQASGGVFELQVATTPKAAAVVKFLNDDAKSPIARRTDLQAYVKGTRVVRIRGFKTKDTSIQSLVHKMKDPTGGGRFRGTIFFKTGPR